jgi:GNAT superfamily N-acetyltransferase
MNLKNNEMLKIKKASDKDVPLILSFIRELAEYENLLHDVIVTERDLRKNLFGTKKYAEVLIAYCNNKPAGMALYFHNFSTFVGKPGIYLEDLFVKPEFRGKGIGKSLLIELIKIARKRNCGRVEWAVLDWNKPAIDFYENLGAEMMGAWRIFRLTKEKITKIAGNI